ncbi:MAG: AAA family ATPase [Planctomycetaceae bacterium]|nr:AAA family ATPase [Planctomycetaceae bacterium]
MITKLKKITIGGYKSFPGNEPLEVMFGDINILIGANGAGKSNFISFFKMLNMMTTGALQEYIGQQGGANSLLHYGFKKTPILEGALDFRDEKNKENAYFFRLAHASPDTLIFTEENTTYRLKPGTSHKKIDLGVGHKESKLLSDDAKQTNSLRIMGMILKKCQVYQFHDTTAKSYIRNKTSTGNNYYLYSDGGNLAAYLLGMKSAESYLPYYKRIVQWIRNIFPLFGDFALEPSPFYPNITMLNWREKGSEYVFGPHQISDGTLRFMALATLLLQPPDLLPNLLIIDEPELGLHPAAVGALAGMVQTASQHCQVILATQSPRLLDEFAPEDIIVAERDKRNQCSILKRLNSGELNDWIEDYCLSELWEKNILGGQP